MTITVIATKTTDLSCISSHGKIQFQISKLARVGGGGLLFVLFYCELHITVVSSAFLAQYRCFMAQYRHSLVQYRHSGLV